MIPGRFQLHDRVRVTWEHPDPERKTFDKQWWGLCVGALATVIGGDKSDVFIRCDNASRGVRVEPYKIEKLEA
jgi:hypothetical protein